MSTHNKNGMVINAPGAMATPSSQAGQARKLVIKPLKRELCSCAVVVHSHPCAAAAATFASSSTVQLSARLCAAFTAKEMSDGQCLLYMQ